MPGSYRIAVVPGDGTGPEVVSEALKLLGAVADGFVVETVPYDLGGVGGFSRKGTRDEVATQESINTRAGVDRCLRFAFELAGEPGRRGNVTLAHKTNVLNYAGDLWMRAFTEMAERYPDVSTDYVHV